MTKSVHEYPEDFDRSAVNPPLTREQQEVVNRLTAADLETIDAAILANVVDNWRKVARIVGTTMNSFADQGLYPGLVDLFYAQRIRLMVNSGQVLSTGDLTRMGYCEVRLPDPATAAPAEGP